MKKQNKYTAHQKIALFGLEQSGALALMKQETALALVKPLYHLWAVEQRADHRKTFAETCFDFGNKVTGGDNIHRTTSRTAAFAHLLNDK